MPCHNSLRFTVGDNLTPRLRCRFTTFNGAAQHENALGKHATWQSVHRTIRSRESFVNFSSEIFHMQWFGQVL
jgi:hypothetical protein